MDLERMNSVMDFISESENLGIISAEESFALQEACCDMYVDAAEDLVEEGANLDIRVIAKESKAEFKVACMKVKTAIKAKDFKKAKKELNRAEKIIDDAIDGMSKVESTVGSFIFGLFTSWTIAFGRNFLICLIPWVGGPVVGIITLIEELIGGVTNYQKNGNKLDLDKFNLYKDKYIGVMSEYKLQLNKYKKQLDKADHKYAGDDDDVEESVSTMLSVYRAYDEGVISEEEKDIFLSALE